MGTKYFKALAQTRQDGDKINRTTVIASTDVEDRAGDIVDQSWELDNFRANPVILWAHQSGGMFEGAPPLPVGKAVSVEVLEGALVAEIEWDTEGAMGSEVARQFRSGFLSAVSVGFRPGQMISRAGLDKGDPRHSERGYVLADNELLEISAVPVPANPEALTVRDGRFVMKADLSALVVEAVRDALASDEECQRLVQHVIDEAGDVARELNIRRDDWWGEEALDDGWDDWAPSTIEDADEDEDGGWF